MKTTAKFEEDIMFVIISSFGTQEKEKNEHANDLCYTLLLWINHAYIIAEYSL